MSRARLILACPQCGARFSEVDYSNPRQALKQHLTIDHPS